MRKFLIIYSLLIITFAPMERADAQPQARRAQQAQQKKSAANALTTRAQISYPIAQQMKEDVVWQACTIP